MSTNGGIMTNEQQKRKLRQSIMAAASKQGWNYDQFHGMMVDWGYGNSLRSLELKRLIELQSLLNKTKVNNKAEYDQQGKYMHAKMKEAGWDMKRLEMFMIKHFKCLHWTALKDDQKRAVITMLTKYADKKKENENEKSHIDSN